MIYGSAWKKERTSELVIDAIEAGFRAVDTAAQPRHYREDLVGDAVRQLIRNGTVTREELYIQTKFTKATAQDPDNMPYDAYLPIPDQIKASVASSLHNFRPNDFSDESSDSYLDCLLMHSPFPTIQDTLQAWKTLETYVPHRIRSLGISNVPLEVLTELYESVDIKPVVVQKRFHPGTTFEGNLRIFCSNRHIKFQGYGILKKNPDLLASEPVVELANKVGVSVQIAQYGLYLGLGDMTALIGTTNAGRMKEDLTALKRVQEWSTVHRETWLAILSSFKELVGDKQ